MENRRPGARNRPKTLPEQPRRQVKSRKLGPWNLQELGLQLKSRKSGEFLLAFMFFGGILGPQIRLKSIKIGSKRRSKLDAFSDLKFYRFWMRFCLQHGLQNRRFFASGARSWIMQKPYFSFRFL